MKSIIVMILATLTLVANSISFESRQEFFIPKKHGNEYDIFSFTSQKDKFITGEWNGHLLLWSLKSGLPIKDFGEIGYIGSLKKSRDNRYLLIHSTLDYNDSVKLLDMQKEELKVLASESQVEGSSYRTDISQDGKYLIFTEGDCNQNIIKVWDIKEGKVIKTFLTHTPDLLQIQISPNNSFIATIAREGVFSLWSMKGKKLFKIKFSTKKGYRRNYTLDITSDEKYVLVGDRLFDVEKNKMIETINPKKNANIYSTQKGNELIFCDDNNITFWDINRSRALGHFSDNEGNITRLRRVNNGKRYFEYTTYLNTPIKKGNSVEISKNKLFDSKKKQSFFYNGVNYAFNENLIAWSDVNKKIHLLERENHAEKVMIDMERAFPLSSAVISKDGNYIASLGDNETISVWDVVQNKLLYSMKENNDTTNPNALLFTSTGEYLIELVANKIEIYNTKKGTHLKTIIMQKEYFYCNKAYLTADDKYLIMDGLEEIAIWNFETNSFVKSDFSLSEIPRMNFSSHDRYVITINDKFGIKLYDLKQIEKPIKEFIQGDKGNWVVFDYQKKRLHSSEDSFIFRKNAQSLKLDLF